MGNTNTIGNMLRDRETERQIIQGNAEAGVAFGARRLIERYGAEEAKHLTEAYVTLARAYGDADNATYWQAVGTYLENLEEITTLGMRISSYLQREDLYGLDLDCERKLTEMLARWYELTGEDY